MAFLGHHRAVLFSVSLLVQMNFEKKSYDYKCTNTTTHMENFPRTKIGTISWSKNGSAHASESINAEFEAYHRTSPLLNTRTVPKYNLHQYKVTIYSREELIIFLSRTMVLIIANCI